MEDRKRDGWDTIENDARAAAIGDVEDRETNGVLAVKDKGAG